jgi:hypothetical protein
MAKVSGPLMSMDARGKFANALVFSNWKGRPVVRQLVIPGNPASTAQMTTRNHLRVTAAAQHFANTATTHGAGRSVTDEAAIRAVTPSGFAWNGHLVKTMIGAGGVNYTAAEAAYTALTSPQKAAWDTAAAALTPAIPSVVQKTAGNVAGTALTGGHVFFLYTYGLYLLTVASVPGATPPTYA